MKNYFNPIFIIFSIIITISSCNKEVDNFIYKDKELFPIPNLIIWTYNNHYYSTSNKDSITEATPVNLILYGKIHLKNEDWYPFTYFTEPKHACINRKNGLWTTKCDYKNKIISLDSASLLFKYPAKRTDVWYSNYFHDSVKIISLEEMIKVPKGEFKCIHYQTKNFNNYLRGNYYVSPGIGIVKCEVVMGINKKDNSPILWNVLELTDINNISNLLEKN